MFNPITKAEEIKQKVVNGNLRRYYRVARGASNIGGGPRRQN